MAAVLASYPSVASHLSAAWLWGLLRSRPETVHITCRSPRPGKRDFVVHRANLARVDLARLDEIPVTSLSRTILDVAVTSRPRTVRRHIQLADDLKLFDLREMNDLLERTKGHRGQAKVRAALELYDEKPVFTRSGLERRFLEVMREAGLPEPARPLRRGFRDRRLLGRAGGRRIWRGHALRWRGPASQGRRERDEGSALRCVTRRRATEDTARRPHGASGGALP